MPGMAWGSQVFRPSTRQVCAPPFPPQHPQGKISFKRQGKISSKRQTASDQKADGPSAKPGGGYFAFKDQRSRPCSGCGQHNTYLTEHELYFLYLDSSSTSMQQRFGRHNGLFNWPAL